MKAALFAFSLRGMETANRMESIMSEEGWTCKKSTSSRLFEELGADKKGFCCIPKPSRPYYGTCFQTSDLLLFVSSCGLAVREIAPFLVSKAQDPAVLVVDEGANFTIALLSGHIGGANRYARWLAEKIGACPVITTATDVNGRFSVDRWAAEQGFRLSSLKEAKLFSAAILEKDLPLECEFPVEGPLPAGLRKARDYEEGIGLYVGVYRSKSPLSLRVIPPLLHLGIGCRRGTARENIEALVSETLAAHDLDVRAIRDVASIDLKKGEEGLLAFCRGHSLPISFYRVQELQEVPGTFTSSDFVKSVTGVDSVAERAACAGGGKLLVKKQAREGVTVALSLEERKIHFD